MALFPTFGNQVAPWLSGNSDTLLQAGVGLLGGRTAPEQVAGLAQGVAGARQKNKTVDFLRSASPELAQAVESGALSGGDAYKLYYQQKLEAEKPRNNLLPVGKNLYDFQNGQWISPPANIAAADVEAGLNLVYGKDKDGNTVAFQPLKTGGLKQVDVPQGVALTPGVTNLDLGTAIQTINSKTGVPVATTPKDLTGAESQKAVGKAQGEAIAGVPGARQTAALVTDQIAKLKSDPYLPNMLGPWNSRLPNTSADAARVQSKIDQLQGGAFLQARQLLKGGGQVTDYEGQKAEAAMVRMNTAQSEADFKAALDDFNDAVQQGVAKLEAASGQQPSQPSAAGSGGATSSGVKWSIEP